MKYSFLLLFALPFNLLFSQNEIIIVKDTLYTNPVRSDLKGSRLLYSFSLMVDTSYNPIGDSIIIKINSTSGLVIIKKIICFSNIETGQTQYSTLITTASRPNILFDAKPNGLFEVIICSSTPLNFCSVDFEIYSKSNNRKIQAPNKSLSGCM